jgi:hypothetical protein
VHGAVKGRPSVRGLSSDGECAGSGVLTLDHTGSFPPAPPLAISYAKVCGQAFSVFLFLKLKTCRKFHVNYERSKGCIISPECVFWDSLQTDVQKRGELNLLAVADEEGYVSIFNTGGTNVPTAMDSHFRTGYIREFSNWVYVIGFFLCTQLHSWILFPSPTKP